MTSAEIISAEHEVQRSVSRLDRAIQELNQSLDESLTHGRKQVSATLSEFHGKTDEVRDLALKFLNQPRELLDGYIEEKIQQAEGFIADQGRMIEAVAVNRYQAARTEIDSAFNLTVDGVENAVARVAAQISENIDREIARLDEQPFITWITCFAAGFAAALIVSGQVRLFPRSSAKEVAA